MNIKDKLKNVIITELKLEEANAQEINDDEPIFGDSFGEAGLGLDSLDAVELVVIIQKHFGVRIEDMEIGKKAFQSITVLAGFIEDNQT